MPRYSLHIVTVTPKSFGQGRTKTHRFIALDADSLQDARAQAESQPGVRVLSVSDKESWKD